MKCPNCGKWNRANMPHCIYCGTELGPSPAPDAAWRSQLDDKSKAKAYIRVDDSGEIETTVDHRDALAAEMAELKKRKRSGEREQLRIRENEPKPEPTLQERTVRTTSNRGTFFETVEDPEVRQVRQGPELMEEDSPAGPEPASRVKYHTVYTSGRQEEAPVSEWQQDRTPHVYDGYEDTSAYYPDEALHATPGTDTQSFRMKNAVPRRYSTRRTLRIILLTVLITLLVGAGGYWGYTLLTAEKKTESTAATVVMTIDEEGLAAHTVYVPGEDGQRITLRELRTSAIVTGGVATFEISDHQWYDDYEDYLQETMHVTLSPYVVEDSGRQTALPQIEYDIDIPLSPIELDTPSSTYQVVSTALYNIIFYVQEGSSVSINGENYSDLVNSSGGKVSYNATVQPIGENTYDIVVRSQYCRENTLTITLYREKQDIPLDLASDTATTSSSASGTMTVTGTTLPGAVIKVLSPYYDLDVTNTASDGSFSFVAKFDQIGNNTIIITADYPGRKTTRVEHTVYYVPNIDVYSRKAWDIVTQYTDLMDNLDLRKNQHQIYVCKGTILSVDTTKPQRCFMNVGTEDSELIIYIENQSKTTWEVGQKYRVYGDAYGMYDSKPWIVVRYTYPMDSN